MEVRRKTKYNDREVGWKEETDKYGHRNSKDIKRKKRKI